MSTVSRTTLHFSCLRAGGLGLACLLVLGERPAGATAVGYTNNAVVTVAPVVDATNFVNNGTFSFFTVTPFETYNTVNFTNRGTLYDPAGFRFSTTPSEGPRRRAGWLDSRGEVDAIGGPGRILIDATNVLLRATNRLDSSGLFEVFGDHLDLSRFTLFMGYSGTAQDTLGYRSDNYWGVGTNQLNPADLESQPAFTPVHTVTNASGDTTAAQLLNASFVNSSQQINDPEASNRVVRVAYLDNFNPDITNRVFFTDTSIVVEWKWEAKDLLSQKVYTNYLYLYDDFGSTTNLGLATNSVGGVVLPPPNYRLVTATQPPAGLPPAAGLKTEPPGVFTGSGVSNEFSAYSVSFQPSVKVPGSLPGQPAITNLPGRALIHAGHNLDLKLARMAGLSYLSLKSTNHFKGALGATIASAYTDLDLGTTNGTLTISELFVPQLPILTGDLRFYSGRWQEIVEGVTNRFHILFVESTLELEVDAVVGNANFRGTNVVLGKQVLNVAGTLSADAQNLWIQTNGAINLREGGLVFALSFPQLNTLTNDGFLSTYNAASFGSSENPYEAMVISGVIAGQGVEAWSSYFQNSGDIYAGQGNLYLNGGDVVLDSGTFSLGDGGGVGEISIQATNLIVINHSLNAPGGLSLNVTNVLDDGGPGSGNQWSAGFPNGVRLLRAPLNGNLLGTTITLELAPYEETPIIWAGTDQGKDPAGYGTNAALQELVLDGGDFSLFKFSGVEPGNALYVETLTLANYATNVAAWLPSIEIAPDFTVYYAQAFANGQDITDSLKAAAQSPELTNRLVWVDYAGAFSSVAIAYSPSETVVMNASLAASTHIDSDADGIVNAADPTPLYTASQVNLKLGLTSTGPRKPQLTWATLPGAQNVVLGKESWSQAGWVTLTNFVSGSNTASWVDQGASNSARLYRVLVNP